MNKTVTIPRSNVEPITKDEAKVVIIGEGELGKALALSMKGSFIENKDKKTFDPMHVYQVSAKEFLLNMDMVEVLSDAQFIIFCGKNLALFARKIVKAMIRAKMQSTHDVSNSLLQFIDFSNPDPKSDASEVPGCLTLWKNLEKESFKTNHTWKVWKVTNISSLDIVSEGIHRAKVYGAGIEKGELPNIRIPGIKWIEDPCGCSTLLEETYDRLMERASVDRWYDTFLLSIGTLVFTAGYAITRYSEWYNGGYHYTMIPLYILDKAICWTALWTFAMPPFAGSILALGAMTSNWSNAYLVDKVIFLLASVALILPTFLFALPWFAWYILRTIFFFKPGYSLYMKQRMEVIDEKISPVKAMLIDMVSLKKETGVVGFFWALTHTFAGSMLADVAYKGKWFKGNGRFHGNIEISLISGCISFAIITAVTIRSLFGKDSYIKLKPMYEYMAPVGLWLATAHVVMMGYEGWYQLFDSNVKNGQPSITWVSTMFTIGVLSAHWLLTIFNTKKRIGYQYFWKHSLTLRALQIFNNIKFEFENDRTLDSTLKLSYFDQE